MKQNEFPTLPSFQLPEEFEAVRYDIVHTAWPIHRAKVVVAFPGLLDKSIAQSGKRWMEDLSRFEHRLIAGYHLEPGIAEIMQLCKKNPGFATFQGKAGSTPDQARWTIEGVRHLDSFAVYVPKFHKSRAVLTLAQAAIRAGWRGKIYPYGWNPGEGKLPLAGFNNQATMAELTPGEHERWVKYTRSGDVAEPSVWQQFRPEV